MRKKCQWTLLIVQRWITYKRIRRQKKNIIAYMLYEIIEGLKHENIS
jgi:hypothetical protein